MFAATLAFAMAAPVMLAGEPVGTAVKPSCFAEMMCTIPLAQGDHPHEWPFSIAAGELSCVAIGPDRALFFAEVLEDPGEIGNMTPTRQVVVTTNPVALLVTLGNSELYAPWNDDLETLLKRLAPYHDIGLTICPDRKPDAGPDKDI
ncbi:MAG: hypothetical protein AB7S80_17060 [Rhizobiaceae bacterium]